MIRLGDGAVSRPMPNSRQATLAVLALRVLYGIALLAAPARTTRSWLGSAGAMGAASVPVRALGAREVAIHAGGIAAVLRGAPVKPWLAASIGGDMADIASTWASARSVPDGSPVKTSVVAGGSAALTAAVAVTLDP